jgi:hypothetical protein
LMKSLLYSYMDNNVAIRILRTVEATLVVRGALSELLKQL